MMTNFLITNVLLKKTYRNKALHALLIIFLGALTISCTSSQSDKTPDYSTLGAIVHRGLAEKSLIENETFRQHLRQAEIRLSPKQRSEKLASIYQSILTLEPDTQVRAQIQHRMIQLDIQKYERDDTYENTDVLEKLARSYEQLLVTYPNRAENEVIQYQLAKTYDLLGNTQQSILTLESLLNTYPNSQFFAEAQFRRAELYYTIEQYPLAYSAYQAVLSAENNENYRLNSLYMSGWSLFKLNRLAEADKSFISVLNEIVNQSEHRISVSDAQRTSKAGNQKSTYEQSTPLSESFSFENVSMSHKSLAMDTQRVLSISLSQQQQEKSLVSLLEQHKSTDQGNNIAVFDHILFKNLADFLLEKGLRYDAILTYKAYMAYAPHSIWSAKYTLALIELRRKRNQFARIKLIKANFVKHFGLSSTFWQQADPSHKRFVLPLLLDFSLAKSRSLYAKAQDIDDDNKRIKAFKNTAVWLNTYLALIEYKAANHAAVQLVTAKHPDAGDNANEIKRLAAQEYFLFAEANFEAGQYQQALNTYHDLAYEPAFDVHETLKASGDDRLSLEYIKQESAYATIVTVQTMLSPFLTKNLTKNQLENKKLANKEFDQKRQSLLAKRQTMNDLFIKHYSFDNRAQFIAVKAAEYAFSQSNIKDVMHYTNVVLTAYDMHELAAYKTVNTENSDVDDFKDEVKAESKPKPESKEKLPTSLSISKKIKAKIKQLDRIALTQLALVSKLNANIHYQFKHYPEAEHLYGFALHFEKKYAKRAALTELIASAIFEQAKGQALLATPESIQQAIYHYLRLGKVAPASKYRANAEFDAGNLLMDTNNWAQAVNVLNKFRQQFPKHKYAATIPAKLALSYEKLGNWSQAAKQLLLMVETEKDYELKRVTQFTAAEYFLKADEPDNANLAFRTYAHEYPEPFGIVQEVRFKMSEYYRETKEPNKRYFWYRKLVKHHKLRTRKSAKKLSTADLERSTYLASYAAFHLGKAHQRTFNQTKLTMPVNASLQRKRAAMTEAINYFQLVFKWQLAEFIPEANYAIGQIYRNLAADIMTSERPGDLDELALEEYEFLLEEIAYPFEEKAIEVHKSNAERAWDDIFDEWVKRSLAVLAEIEPAKYNKYETVPGGFDEIY